MIFSNIFEPTSTNFIFGQFSVVRKLILNAELSGRQASCCTLHHFLKKTGL